MYSDSHSHLEGYQEGQLDTVLSDVQAKGVEMVVGVCTPPEGLDAAIELSRRFPGVYHAIGVHPWHVRPLDEAGLDQLRQMAAHDEVVAIGEVGVDLNKAPETAELQKQVFRQQVVLARELDMPVMLHCRGARDVMLEIVRSEGPIRGVVHGFDGTASDAQTWMALGLYIGVGIRGMTRNFTPAFGEAVKAVPLERMLLETDSSGGSYNGEEGLHPGKVIDLAQLVANLKRVTAEEAGRQTTANLRAMLRK